MSANKALASERCRNCARVDTTPDEDLPDLPP